MPTTIFISHTASDEALASALVGCLLSCMVLSDDQLRCTSVPGHKLPVGSDFAKTLVEDIGGSSVVVGILTASSLTSSWVLFELGAAWGSGKNLMPLLADSVEIKSLPGPLVSRHVARLSSRSDLVQFIDELASLTGARRRTAPKIDKAITDLMAAHGAVMSAATAPASKRKIETKAKEPQFSGMSFSELIKVLRNETVTVPAKHAGGEESKEISLFELFVGNAQALAEGLLSSAGADTAGGFLYRELGLRLLPFGLSQFDKLPAAQAKWFKRVTTSQEGLKFLLQYKRISSERERDA